MKTSDLKINVISLSVIISCTGCFVQSEWTYWSDKTYEVVDDPEKDCKTLYHKLENGGGIGRITCITRLGYNEDYIIASSLQEDKELEQFWILNKNMDSQFKNSEDIVDGPFTIEQFDSKIKILNIEDVKFKKVWK